MVITKGETPMILVIDAVNRDCYRSILDDMFRLRARVFAGRLGWDVQITSYD